MLSSGFKLFRLFRLNKALKALKFLRYSHSFELILNVIKREKRALAAVCVLAGRVYRAVGAHHVSGGARQL